MPLHHGRMSDPLRMLRRMALAEAVSYLVLLLVAMPLKWIWNLPATVRYVGMLHGVLFLLLIWFLLRAYFERAWPKARLMRILIASFVPLWPFFLDRDMQRWIAETTPSA
jgi:integral membrane protein